MFLGMILANTHTNIHMNRDKEIFQLFFLCISCLLVGLTLQLVPKGKFWSCSYYSFIKSETLGGGKIKIFGFSFQVSCLRCDEFSILKQCRNNLSNG